MGGCPYVIAIIGTWLVGGCAIFTETQGSGLDLTGFGDKVCHEGDNYIKAIVIWSKVWSINDPVLRNWGACVDTAFGSVKIVKMDQSVVGKLLHYTSRKVSMRISRWRLLPMKGDDR